MNDHNWHGVVQDPLDATVRNLIDRMDAAGEGSHEYEAARQHLHRLIDTNPDALHFVEEYRWAQADPITAPVVIEQELQAGISALVALGLFGGLRKRRACAI